MNAWRASATRAGVYMVLRVTKSWYFELDFGLLAVQHTITEAGLVAVKDELLVRASDVASFVAWDDYILAEG